MKWLNIRRYKGSVYKLENCKRTDGEDEGETLASAVAVNFSPGIYKYKKPEAWSGSSEDDNYSDSPVSM